MSKVFQILNGFCYKDYTQSYASAEEARKFYAPDIVFVDAPDYVFESWGFDENKTGDERFIKPTAPKGWIYDEETGTFYNKTEPLRREIENLKNSLSDTDYKVIKCSEASLTGEVLPYSVEALHKERQEIRDKINQLEIELEEEIKNQDEQYEE